ncbi:DDE-type integrase/transposase/recombinase [Arenimonas soli]|nr:DDE-type integrase/transposase/recombinase [Arenimonas soli]
MNRMPLAKRAQILGFLVEGMSLRAASRLADCSINTVTKLLVDVGMACAEYQDRELRNLSCQRVQCDEVWSFVGCKQRNLPAERKAESGVGDVWTWTAIDADSKLVLSWLVGDRDKEAATMFVSDLASRLSNRIQLTTDGYRIYLEAVNSGFDVPVDYGMLVKHYSEGQQGPERKYSPSKFVSAERRKVMGKPDKAHISTSYVERQNLTMRMSVRRFTRLTNGFSKKAENHAHAVALHFMYYNFGRIHKTLRVTPAMEAGVASHVWRLEEIAALVPEPVAKKRGPYKKKPR